MEPGAPILLTISAHQGVEPKPDKPTNIASSIQFKRGDVEVGFAEADFIVERGFTPRWCIRAISSRTTASASTPPTATRRSVLDPGPVHGARLCAKVLGMRGNIRVVPAEIGGGFGGKTTSTSSRWRWCSRKRPGGR